VKTRVFAFALLLSAAAVPSFADRPSLALAAHAMPSPVPSHLVPLFIEAGHKYGIDPNLLAAQAFKESRYDARAVSRFGAEGIMQLKPKTARSLGATDTFDPRQNIMAGAKYLRKQLDRFNGDIAMALAAYNAGPERVAKEGPNATAEATEYVATITKYYAAALRASSRETVKIARNEH
jgi:soluble lytic murein transglycosylase-like protein